MQPHSVGLFPYRLRMGKSTTKTVLWENVLTLMERAYGSENLTRLARDTHIGPGSASRIKAQETSVGVDVLEKIAEKFEVQPWQLLSENLGAELYVIKDQRVVPLVDLGDPNTYRKNKGLGPIIRGESANKPKRSG